MINSYIKLAFAALIPVVATIFFYLITKKTAFGKLSYASRQIIYGLVFGAIAIIGTEWGIPIDGAQVNCRDAAVLSTGLIFGGPSGIIAGLIGGVERWISVAWGVSAFSQVACTVSTIIAGFYAAILRKFMFDNKKPNWLLSFAIGIVMEVFHMIMLIVTKLNDVEKAMEVVKASSMIMIVANGISVMLATLAVTALSRERVTVNHKKISQISQTVQGWLLLCVIIAFFLSTSFMFNLQDKEAKSQAENLLKLAITDVKGDIEEASNENLLSLAKTVKKSVNKDTIFEIAKKNNLAEINIVNSNGIIEKSTNQKFVGYNMAKGEQSREFMCLLYGTEEYVQDYRPMSFDNVTMRKYAGVKTDNGFIQVGYDAEQFQKDIDHKVTNATLNRHVGSTGYILIADKAGNIVSAPGNIKGQALEKSGMTLDAVNMAENRMFECKIRDDTNYCMYAVSEGYYIISILPKSEALKSRDDAVYINSFMEVLVFAIVFAMIYILIKRVIVNKMRKINESLSEISNGNLDVVVDVRSNSEFASLSDDINTTVNTLKRYIEEAEARIDAELVFAQNIQKSALPSVEGVQSKRNDFEIFASMNTAKEVGGDFYDFYFTKKDTLNFLIADVSGKGIPAAMFMMRAKTELRSLTETNHEIDYVFTHANNSLCEGNDAGMFVTAWQGNLNLKTGLVNFANAGHNPPLIKRADGKFEFINCKAGLVLAGMEGLKYKQQQLKLEVGDIMYLYTDGVTEATNSSNELYGEERLLNILNSKSFSSTEEMCKAVKSDVDNFVGDAPQFDDITMLALHFKGDQSKKLSFNRASIEDIPAVTEFVESELEAIGCPMKVIVQMNIAVDEIYSNISKFAYKDGIGPVTVIFKERTDIRAVQLQFIDEGVPYNPLTNSDPDITLSADERQIGGLGIYMVKNTMDDMRYKYENNKNVLTITKKF